MIAVKILGNNSALPAFDRHPTSQIVTYNNEENIVIDCGEGTFFQIDKYHVNWNKIKVILISHMHGDHFLGLPGLLNSMGLLGRTKDLYLFGPPELKSVLDLHLNVTKRQLPYHVFFYSLPEKSSFIYEDAHFSIRSFPTEHGIPCHGFVISTINKERTLLKEKAEALGIPQQFYSELKKGKDYVDDKGQTIAHQLVTETPKEIHKYAFCADTRYVETFLPEIQGVDLLYHETTYLDAMREKAYERFHSTTVQAATIAKKAKVKHLLIGHFSSRYRELTPFVEEARTVFSNTDLAEEGMNFEF